MDPILGDYARNVPDARDAEVLSMFAAMINRLREKMEPEVPRIFEAVFECTLGMITQNMEDYPEHRLKFFGLLRAVTKFCPRTLFNMSEGQLKLVIDSVIWAFRHTERNIADTGLRLLYEMLNTFKNSDAATAFYKAYYLQLLRKYLQSSRIRSISQVLYCKPISCTICSQSSSQMSSRPHYGTIAWQVQAAVIGMLDLKEISSFKQHLRDFLVQSNKFMDQNNADLYAEEVAAAKKAELQRMAQIPGLLHDQDDLTGDISD
eukprot:jgi/Picre1/29703/NNA_005086.t1